MSSQVADLAMPAGWEDFEAALDASLRRERAEYAMAAQRNGVLGAVASDAWMLLDREITTCWQRLCAGAA